MQRLLVLGLLMIGFGGSNGFSTIVNGGDRGILVASVPNNPESAADCPGDVIGWYQPGTLTCTSNITEVQTATTIVRVVPQTIYTKKAGTFTANVCIENVEGLDGVELYLLFDPTKIALIGSPTIGNAITSEFERTLGTGCFRLVAGNLNSSFIGTGTIAINAIFQSLVDDPTSKIEIGTESSFRSIVTGKIPYAAFACQISQYSLSSFVLSYPIDVYAGRPFTIRVTAKDQSNNTLKDYQVPVTVNPNLGTITCSSLNFMNGIAIATITRFEAKTIILTIFDPQASISAKTGSITVRYVGDFGGSNGKEPDQKMTIDDIMLFIQYWRTQDPRGDLGGNVISGTPPYIISTPDGKVGIEDLLIFIQMWRWSNKKKGLELGSLVPKVVLSPSRVEAEKGKRFYVEARITDGSSLVGCGLGIRYDPSKIKPVSVEEGDYFKEGFPFKYEVKEGIIKIDDAGSNIEDGVSGSGLVTKIEFEVLTEDPTSKIEIVAQDSLLLGVEGIRNYTAEAIQVEPAGPAYSALFQSVPNPAREGVWIPYQLAEGAEVEIRVYNILGQVVKNIEIGYKPKRFYKALQQDGAARWDLTNDSNQRVANGLYFYQLKAGRFSDTKSLAISR
ncbi:MAG: cohesin domain-containing protein [bacterium]|nr:cohesin domain-containing protein [bacterium]